MTGVSDRVADGYLAVRGPLAAAGRAFSVRFADYRLGGQGRVDYTNTATKGGPLVYTLRTLGINGAGAAALKAAPGYDDATGVGSPADYIRSFTKA